jgi:hypothetical protein
MPNFTKSKGFQLRSGNIAKAPFKMMGSSPAKQSYGFSMTDDKTKDITTPDNDNKVITKKQSAKDVILEGESSKKVRVATPKELRKKHRKEGNRITNKERKEAGEGTVASRTLKGVKKGAKKAGNWLGRGWKKFQAHHDSGEGKKVEAEFLELGEMLDPSKKGMAQNIRDNMQKEATIKKSDVFAKSEAEKQAKKEKRDVEAHESQLLVDQSLVNARNNKVTKGESINQDNTTDATEPFAVNEDGVTT